MGDYYLLHYLAHVVVCQKVGDERIAITRLYGVGRQSCGSSLKGGARRIVDFLDGVARLNYLYFGGVPDHECI